MVAMERSDAAHVQFSIVRILALCERGGMDRLADVNEPNVYKALRMRSATNLTPKPSTTIGPHYIASANGRFGSNVCSAVTRWRRSRRRKRTVTFASDAGL